MKKKYCISVWTKYEALFSQKIQISLVFDLFNMCVIIAVPDQKPWLSTFAAWGGVHPCLGKFVRGVCVFGLGDLTELVSRKELFVNKFYYYYQPYALQCLEEWHFNNTFSVLPFKTHYYKTLPFIIRQVFRKLVEEKAVTVYVQCVFIDTMGC